MASVGYRDLAKYRAVTSAGASGEVPRYLIDNLLTEFGSGTPSNVRFLLVPTNTCTQNDIAPDLGLRGLYGTIQVTHSADPVLRGGLLSPIFNAGNTEYWTVADNALLSFDDTATTTGAFSVMCWVKAGAITADHTIVAKYDDQTPDAEYRLTIDSNGYPEFVLYDDSVVNGYRGREDQTSVGLDTWVFLLCTYDGRGGLTAENGIAIYRGSAAAFSTTPVDDASVNGAGAYVAMENTAQPVSVGAAETGAGPVYADWLHGELPVLAITLGEVSAARAEKCWAITREMLGLG